MFAFTGCSPRVDCLDRRRGWSAKRASGEPTRIAARSTRLHPGLSSRVAAALGHVFDPGVEVGETGALGLRGEAFVVLAPHHVVEPIGREAEARAKGAAELILGMKSVVARDGTQRRLRCA